MQRFLIAALLLALLGAPAAAWAQTATAQPVKELNFNVNGGLQTVLESSNRRGTTERYDMLVIVDPESGPGQPVLVWGEMSKPHYHLGLPPGALPLLIMQQTMPPAILAAAQQFVLCGLRLTVYCPGADRLEVEVSRADQAAPELVQYPGELVPRYYLPPEAVLSYAGSLSTAMNTPDMGWAELPAAGL